MGTIQLIKTTFILLYFVVIVKANKKQLNCISLIYI